MEQNIYPYSAFPHLRETEEHFLLLRDICHAIILDKSSFTLGTVKEFRDFIEDKTDNSLQYIK